MIKKKYIYNMSKTSLCIGLLFLVFSCTSKKEEHQLNYTIKVVEAKPVSIHPDSIIEPNIIPLNENSVNKKAVVNSSIFPAYSNILSAGSPTVISAGTPKIFISDQDTVSLPQVVNAVDSPFVAGIPQVVFAKDAYIKDQNPHSFSTFNKLQGLKHGTINCLLEDQFGNLWFGTSGGGVTRYDGKYFTHYTDKEGLSGNVINSMLLDRNKNIWLGTDGNGLIRFDGKNFTHFTTQEGMSYDVVNSILEDREGNIWIATDGGGVSKFDGKKFTHYNEKTGLVNNRIRSMMMDKSGNIWLGTNNSGVLKFNGKEFTNYTQNEGLSSNIILCLLEDQSGNIWLGTDGGGLIKFDGKLFTIYGKQEGLLNTVIWSLYEDKSGNIWLGSWGGGVAKFNGKYFTHFTEKDGLSNNVVLSILEDQSGNMWLGTNGGGVSKYDGKLFTHFTANEGLKNSYARSIIEDLSGNLWFATYGGGVCKYDGENFTHYTEKEGLCDNDVRCMIKDQSGNIWMGTFGGGISKYDGKYFTNYNENSGLIHNYILSMIEDRSGNIWIGTNGLGVVKFDGKSFTNYNQTSGLSNNTILSIIEDRNGNIWFGTNGGGVTKYELSTNNKPKLIHYTKSNGLNDDNVRAMMEDRNGNIWFGTSGGGVAKLEGNNFTHFTEKEGLSHNHILSMLEDQSGNFWFGTRFGLSKLSPENLKLMTQKINSNSVKESDVFFKNYTYEDGFLGIGVNGGKTIYQDKTGIIWIGANDRLTAFHPEGEDRKNVAPEIQLTGIALFNENIPWAILEKNKDSTLILGNGVSVGDLKFEEVMKWNSLPDQLSLAYNNNFLTFRFIGITMHQPKLVKYQYKLEGIDENWSAITNQTEAAYGNLLHGTYTFKVKAMNSEGLWSNTLKYTFTIRPPWWKTWWFQLSYISTLVFLIFSVFRWRTNSLRKRQKQLEQTVQERTEELVFKNSQVEKQKEIVEEKNREILDSIAYAKRIQDAILPGSQKWKENLPDSFILYLPKDIIAGDFYWMEETENYIFIAAADCTGHGIPGALVSVVCSNALTLAVVEDRIYETSSILNRVNELVIEKLSGNDHETVRDGMDISLIRINKKNRNEILYSGANRPLWIIQNNDLIELKPDKQPIGYSEFHLPFHEQKIHLNTNDLVYLFTDGYTDQFGGETKQPDKFGGKKFMYKRLKKLLLDISYEPLDLQKQILHEAFSKWKGDLDQVDDICIIGVRI